MTIKHLVALVSSIGIAAFSLPVAAHVEISVYNILGEKVSTLVDEECSFGAYSVEWNGTNDRGKPMASGIYYNIMKAGDFRSMKKMLLLK